MADWYLQLKGKTIGPMPAERISQMLADGTITRSDLIWCRGVPDWVRISTLREFGGEPRPPIPDDPGPFRKIGTTFYLSGKESVGTVIASPLAVYLLATRNLAALSIGHSVATTVLKTALKAMLPREEEVRTCVWVEIPSNVRSALDPKGTRQVGTVVVVRRAAVDFVKVPRIYNVITLRLGEHRVSVATSWFGVRKVGRWLEEQGWTINQPLLPTEEPMHGPGFRREGRVKDESARA